MVILLLVLAVVIILVFAIRMFKIPKVGCVLMINGAVKTGKTLLAVHVSRRKYRRQIIKYYIKRTLLKLFKPKKLDLLEKPLLYSNIPLKIKGYTPLKKEHLERKERFKYGSVVLISESSLFADSLTIKDEDLNERLLLFAKLIGHELKGGFLIMDTQSILDNHYNVKRSISSYLYIHSCNKWIPFFFVLKVREMLYCGGVEGVTNTYDRDIEQSMLIVLIPKKTKRMYDRYCYSVLTDNCKVTGEPVEPETLKANDIVSFKNWRTIK